MSSLASAPSDLTGLYGIFADVPRAWFVSPEETPEPYRSLLAHHHHMTVTMEEHHGAPVELSRITEVRDGNWYARKILLTHSKTGDVVMFGIMRFNFDWCEDAIRERILDGTTPLGRILIEHDVLRRISTHALMRIRPNHEMREHFNLPAPSNASDHTVVYGRLATIFCNDEAAVDLLEIVAPAR